MTTTTIIILLAAAVAVLVVLVSLLFWHAYRQERDMKLKNDVIIREVKKNDHLKEELRESKQKLGHHAALLTVIALMAAIGAQAQIPAEVKDTLQKCSEKSQYSGGTEIDMKLHVGAVIASMNGTMKVYKKGDKSFSIVKMKALGHEIYGETGFDGTQEWKYSKASDDDERDTLAITKRAKKSKDKFSINLGLDKEYKKAKLKTTDKCYEITFTDPLKKETPKKAILRIDKDKNLLHEYETKVSIASVKMTMTRIKYGVNDNVFVLDTKKYPNAVIVRK